MKKILFAIFGLLGALFVNSAVGAAVGGVVCGKPVYGAIAANVISFSAGLFGGLAPAGSLCAGLLAEVWTGAMIKAFRTDPAALGWYNKIRSYDQYAENDLIHFVNLGGDPDVLVNNTTYPLDVQDLADADKPIALDKFQTKPTRITDDEMYSLSYDKKASVIERHHSALSEEKYSRAIHALAPGGNTTLTPVIATTGSVVDGRLAMTRQDIIDLKKAFDKNKVTGVRVLVLCPDHVADLLTSDQKFSDQYYNYTTGKIANLYGFEVYEYSKCPYYNAGTLAKLAYGAVSADTDNQASVAFSVARAMKANGTLKAYASEAKDNPTTQENLLSFRMYTICLPLKEDAMGAIVSAKSV